MTAGALAARRTAPDHRRAVVGIVAVVAGSLLALVLVALGAPVGVAAVAVFGIAGLGLLNRPDAATYLFIGLLYLNVPVVAVRIHGAPDLVAVAAPLLLMIPFVTYMVFRREPPVVTPALFWMIAYLAALLISAAASADPEATVVAVTSFASEGLVLYLLVTTAVRRWSTLRTAVTVLLVAGAIMGGLSIFQELTQTYDNQYLGFAQTKETDPFELVQEDDERPRLSGPIGSKNRYAQVMIVLMPLAMFAFITGKSRKEQAFAAVSGVAILGGMLLTFSRGAGVALVVLVVIAIVLRYIRLRQAVAVSVALAVAVAVLMPQYLGRLVTVGEVANLASGATEEADGAILGRATSNLASLQVFFDYPIVGVGPGQYVAEYSQEYANDLGLRYFTDARRAHNLFLEVAADSGIAGVVTFGGIFATTVAGLWRVRRTWKDRDADRAAWATALVLAVIGYLLTAVFLHLAYMRYLWLLIALANSAIWILDREARDVAVVSPSRAVKRSAEALAST